MLKNFKNLIYRLMNNSDQGLSLSTEQPDSSLQLYRGYSEDDFQIIKKFSKFKSKKETDQYIDGFGVKTLYDCVPFVKSDSMSLSRLEFPVPDDGFHAEAIEYVALTDSLDRSNLNDSFCAVEIGAGWGPWITAAGVVASQYKCKNIKLVGIEASLKRFSLLCRHLQNNNLRNLAPFTEDQQHGRVFTRLFNGAAWTHDGNIWFPDSDVVDMGAAASTINQATDYRGAVFENKSIPCRRLDTLLNDLGRIDFMHIDIQGAETDLIRDQIIWITNNVTTLMVATHSRSIEGELIVLLFDHGWHLYREKPCRVDWGLTCSLAGRTTVDGSQYWINSKYTRI